MSMTPDMKRRADAFCDGISGKTAEANSESSEREARLDRLVSQAAVRIGDDGALDELVATNAEVHLEQLDKGYWFLYVRAGNVEHRVWLHSKKRIRANTEASKAG